MTFSDPASRVACKIQSDRISQKTAACADSLVQVILPTQTGSHDASEKSTLYCARLFYSQKADFILEIYCHIQTITYFSGRKKLCLLQIVEISV